MVKLAVEILFNGKEFRSIETSDLSDEEKLLTQAMAADVEAALEPLRAAVEEEGGSVLIDFKRQTMFQIETRDLSEELVAQVHKALIPAKQRKGSRQ